MSEFDDLVDLGRMKISAKADRVLVALNRSTGKSKQQLLREWADERADQWIHDATFVLRLTRGKGDGEP